MIRKPRDRMSRRSVCTMSIGALASVAFPRLSAAGPLEHLFQSKDHYTGPVAKKLAEFKEEEFYPSALAFNGGGSQLAVNFMVATDGVHLWNWRDPKSHPRILDYPGGPGDGSALAYTPDGKFLAVRHGIMNDGRVIRIWNAETGELAQEVVEHQGQGVSAGMTFSPDNKLIALTISNASSPNRDQILVFQTDTWELAWALRTLPFLADLAAFSPDGKLLALSGIEWPRVGTPPTHKILVFDIATRQVVLTINAPFPDYISPSALAWSPDGLHLAAGGCAGCGHRETDIPPSSETVNVIEVATGVRVATVKARLSSLNGLAYSPNGKYLIAGSVDDSVQIMDGHTYALLQRIPGDGRSVAVSRDSRYLAIAAYPRISVWELKN